MNVTELARRLKITTAELLDILPELGFDIGAKAIKVDDSLVDKIKEAYKNYQKKIKFEEEEAKIKEIKIGDKEKISKNKEDKLISIDDDIIVRDLAEKMNLPINKVMAELMQNGIIVSLNSTIDFETAAIIAEDLSFKVKKISTDKKEKEIEKKKVQKLEQLLSQDANKKPKSPVVVVMGHVDHGKTKLLDTIRKTNVINSESGNITQHIGAYTAKINNKSITFLDTPGHEAFRAMRARGSKIADIGIIVIAADEGLQPQTIESIELAQKEKLPFVIAINKIDKPEADIEKIKKELSEINLTPEDWGGKTICVSISAKKETNISNLLEMITLVADMEKLEADETRKAIGTIIESHIDTNQGPVATVLIQTGTLHIGDYFITSHTFGRVKAMIDHLNQSLKEAGPSIPVRILGFKDAPDVGDIFNAEISDNDLKMIKKQSIKSVEHYKKVESSVKTDTSADSKDGEKTKYFNIILKTDVIGSKEAIIESLKQIKTNEIEVKIVKSGLGSINDKDIIDAETTNSIIVGFHVQINNNALLLAKEKNITIKNYTIIYKLLEEIEKNIKDLSSTQITREQIGEIKILAIFKTMQNKMIIGGKIIKGKVIKEATAKVMQGDNCVAIGKITDLQSGKEDVNEVVGGQECGLEFTGEPIIKKGDKLEIYKETTNK